MPNFKTIMIKMKGDPVSERYAAYCARSWTDFDMRVFKAVTPDTLPEVVEQYNDIIKFDESRKTITDTEKACFYSQYVLWRKCAVEQVPTLVLEHDAYLEKPEFIKFDPRVQLTFFGQHSMEAVMYHPHFANRLVQHIEKGHKVTGPMALVDMLIGYSRPGTQSRHALPHTRFLGKLAPVRSVLDPRLGTSVDHSGKSTADRLKNDADLFKIVDVNKMLNIAAALRPENNS